MPIPSTSSKNDDKSKEIKSKTDIIIDTKSKEIKSKTDKSNEDSSNSDRFSRYGFLRILLSGFSLSSSDILMLKNYKIKVVDSYEKEYDYLIMDKFIKSIKFLLSITYSV